MDTENKSDMRNADITNDNRMKTNAMDFDRNDIKNLPLILEERRRMRNQHKKKRKKRQYKQLTEREQCESAARFLAKCMIAEADSSGWYVIGIKEECDINYYDGRKETVEVGGTIDAPPEEAIRGQEMGLCEILYNPFEISVDGKNDEKLVNFYFNRFMENDIKKKISKEVGEDMCCEIKDGVKGGIRSGLDMIQ